MEENDQSMGKSYRPCNRQLLQVAHLARPQWRPAETGPTCTLRTSGGFAVPGDSQGLPATQGEFLTWQAGPKQTMCGVWVGEQTWRKMRLCRNKKTKPKQKFVTDILRDVRSYIVSMKQQNATKKKEKEMRNSTEWLKSKD